MQSTICAQRHGRNCFLWLVRTLSGGRELSDVCCIMHILWSLGSLGFMVLGVGGSKCCTLFWGIYQMCSFLGWRSLRKVESSWNLPSHTRLCFHHNSLNIYHSFTIWRHSFSVPLTTFSAAHDDSQKENLTKELTESSNLSRFLHIEAS